jgi:GxxExxY protein
MGEYVPDLVVQQTLIVDTKTIDRITEHERGQMLNYLRITTLAVGIILNFKRAAGMGAARANRRSENRSR